MKIAYLAALAALCLLDQDPKTLSVRTADGRAMRVQVLGLDGDTAKLKVLVVGGEMTVTHPLSYFSPASAFDIEELATDARTFDAHFALAKKAGTLRLLGPAGEHARAAVATAAGTPEADAKRNEVRGWAADALESMFDEAIGAKDAKNAAHYLKLLSTRLADQRSEEQLDALAAKSDALDATIAAEKAEARQAKLDAKVRSDIDKRLKPIEARIAQGDKLQRDAIKKSRNTTQSSNLAGQSIDAYKAAWKATQELQSKYPDDADLTREVEAIGTRLHDSAIRSALHAANMLTVQSDYKGAMDWANKVLAFDPDNSEAKEMVRTIQIAAAAASSEWGWGWRVVGGPDPRRQ